MIIQKTLNFLFAIAVALVFVILGLYILNTYQTRTGQLIGYVNIIFFGGLIVWTLYKIITRKKLNKT